MDDLIILAQTKRQYIRAKKKVAQILKDLKLTLSPHKTRMGPLSKGFHFLGVNFHGTPSHESQSHWAISIHDRSCRRALDKVIAMTDIAVNPAQVQQYLSRWAQWWVRSTHRQLSYLSLITEWHKFTTSHPTHLAWLADGLLSDDTPERVLTRTTLAH